MTTTIRVETRGDGVTRLTLARPDKHNALNPAMIAELDAAFHMIAADPAVRVLVLAADGRSFCAGGDLDWMRAQATRSRAERQAEAGALARMLERLDALPKLVIGIVQGAAYGGGIGLVSLCDIAFATPEARFALTEVKLGLMPATIGPFVVRRVGPAHARRIMLNARPFDAGEACRMGLVAAVVPERELDAALDQEIEFALKCKAGAVAATKSLIDRLARGEALSGDQTSSLLADRWETDEAQTGLREFFAARNRD